MKKPKVAKVTYTFESGDTVTLRRNGNAYVNGNYFTTFTFPALTQAKAIRALEMYGGPKNQK